MENLDLDIKTDTDPNTTIKRKYKTITVADTSFGRSKLDRVLGLFQDTFGPWGDIVIENVVYTRAEQPRDMLIIFSYCVDKEEVKKYNLDCQRMIEGV